MSSKTSPSSPGRKPAAFKIPPRSEAPEPSPAQKPKPRKPKSVMPEPAMVVAPDVAAQRLPDTELATLDQELTPPLPNARRKRFSWGGLLFAAVGSLVTLAMGIAIDQLIRDLFARHEWLGWVGSVATALLVLAAIIIVIKELWGMAGLRRIDRFRRDGAEILKTNDSKAASKLLEALTRHYASRPETANGRARLANYRGEVIDGRDLVGLMEKDLLAPLDARARKMVLTSAKRVSVVTAVSPRAIVDLAFVLMENMRLTRNLSELYGGRPGFFGFLRLFKNVISHLAVTGSIALGDSLMQQFVGQGLAARLSSKLGEGVVNGVLTARIGIAAMDVCRPLPFNRQPRPGIGDFLSDLLPLGGKSTDTANGH